SLALAVIPAAQMGEARPQGPKACIKPKCPAGWAGHSWGTAPGRLLELGLFVVDVLASNGIKFFDQHFLGHVALVFGGRVEVTGTGRGFEFDLLADAFSHDVLLDEVYRCGT